MLHLQTRIHFHKEKFAILTGDKFNRARTAIRNRPGSRHGGVAHFFAHVFIHGQIRRGCFFQDFLVAALDRTFTLIQMHIVAVRIAEDLKFNMMRAKHKTLNQHIVITKCVLGFTSCGFELRYKLGRFFNESHTLAAAAGHRFDQQRIAHNIRLLSKKIRVLIIAMIARHHRHFGGLHQRFRRAF